MKKLFLFLFLATATIFAQTPTEQRILANSTDLTVTGLAGQSTLNNNILEPTATSNGTDLFGKYRNLNVQIVASAGISAGAIIFEGSNVLSGTYVAIPFDDISNLNASFNNLATSQNIAASANRFFKTNTKFQFIKCRISTAFVGGTIQAFSKFSPNETNNLVQIVKNSTASDLQTASSQVGVWSFNPVNTPSQTTTGDLGIKTASLNGITMNNTNAKGALIVINEGLISGTSPTLVAKLQGSADGGTTWVDIPNATTATLTGTGVYGIMIYPGVFAVAATTVNNTTAVVNSILPRVWRVAYIIGGTSPNFSLTNIQVQYIL